MAMVDPIEKSADSPRQCGGHVPGGEGQPAFALFEREPSPLPVLIAVPHAGRIYPPDLIANMRHAGDACIRLEDRFVDLVARAVAKQTGASLLLAYAPRAMIDLNRAPEDMDWEMVAGGAPSASPMFAAGRRARSGLGLVPRRLPVLGELWKRQMSPRDLSDRIELVHKPYHSTLNQLLESMRDRWGTALLIDMHSMPPLGRKTGHDAAADYVLGDRYGSSCSSALSMAAFDHFEMCRTRAVHNRPYAGGYVLERHSNPARGLHAMQIEICRAAYLDAMLQEPGEGLEQVVDVLAGLVRRMAEELASNCRGFAQAAE